MGTRTPGLEARSRGRDGSRWALALVVALAPLPCAAGAAPRHVALANPALAANPQARERLKYLVGCALPEGVVLDAEADGVRYAFSGALGLAPAWSQRALTPEEARWVSACILARSNHFGRTVEISLRADAAPNGALAVDAAEQARFPRHEAGFFGNIFDAAAPAYVCTGDDDPQRAAQLRAQWRVCGVADGSRSAEGVPFSHCGFLVVGPCATRPFVQGGIDYSRQVIHVFLPAPRDGVP